MTTQRKALEAAREFIGTVLLGTVGVPWGRNTLLAQIDAALAEPDAPHVGMHDPQAALAVPGKKRVSAVLRWEKNVFYLAKLEMGRTWSNSLNQHGYFNLLGLDNRKKYLSEPEARAALEAAVLALLASGEKAVGGE